MAPTYPIRYRNYLVRLTGGDGDRLLVQSCHQERWGNRVEISLPPVFLDPNEIAQLAATDPEEVGRALFEALFGDDGGRFRAALARAEGRLQRGIRLRLSFDLSHPTVARAARLPWELLYDPYGGRFLSQSIYTPIVRSLDREDASESPEAEAPLTVLVIHAEPTGCAPLEVEAEIEGLIETVEGPDVEVIRRRASTWDELREHLLETDARCDVVHFIGHGDVSFGEDGTGSLWFEGEDGSPQSVSGRELGDLLRDKPTIRLVVLNACSTAAQPADTDPYAGVAQALVLAGVPAVVAMSRSLVDAAARQFSRTFYRALARREPVDVAVARARLALRDAKFAPTVWAIPALFLQASESELFRFGPRSLWASARDKVRRHRKPLSLLLLLALLLVGTRLIPPRYVLGAWLNPPQCPSPQGLNLAMVYVDPARWWTGDLEGHKSSYLAPAPYCIARFELAQWQYRRVMGGTEADTSWWDRWLPAHTLSRDDAERFIEQLDDYDDASALRLPKESEWLVAARAGTPGDTAFTFGELETDMSVYGNCGDTDGPLPVGSFKANPLAIYDLHGNVSEWVEEETQEGGGDEDFRTRGLRYGGGWNSVISACAIDNPSPILRDTRMADAGLRLARDPTPLE